MGVWARKRTERREAPAALAKRIAIVPTPEITPWIESSLYHIGKGLLDYGRDPNPDLLEEALGAAEVVVELLQEYRRRMTLLL